MKLIMDGIKNREAWEKAGIQLPGYNVKEVSEKAKKEPRWVHFGIGNIFRVFIGGIADGLLEEGALDRGLTCVETFDYDVVCCCVNCGQGNELDGLEERYSSWRRKP